MSSLFKMKQSSQILLMSLALSSSAFATDLVPTFEFVSNSNSTKGTVMQNRNDTAPSTNIIIADEPKTQYPNANEFVEVEFGPHKALVPKGGFYDRFHMQPNLDEVAKDPLVGNVDFFKKIPKQLVETRVGKVWSPNYYYKTSNVQLLMLAPLDKLKAKLPAQVEPLSPIHGYGLVSLTFFAYDICDNDPYDEVSVAVVVRRPNAKGSNISELISSIRNRDYYGYVLALPVDTEIARIRGVHGYSLPKWLTAIDLKIDDNVQAHLYDTNGKIDISLTAPTPKLKTVKNESHLEKKTMLNQVEGTWYSSYVQANNQTFAQKTFPKNVELQRNGGPVSKLLDQLGAKKILRMDVIKDAQLALHMPTPIDEWNK
ncbi:MAG: acetoacetate decarboxylase [Acinetobacter sp.]|uniref:acetoacetate decarboxylase n=1 Tax=Acinetobacter sp. TaxID=472 RepID=UPI0026E0B64E|nr:acetoacetate decarboxylase [Acinetobacter sp.]MDO5543523.1 acetoacetate decarboxylase [Acinetobacter sp.]